MFRHERPQKGRLRQFHQIGVELIGVPLPQLDRADYAAQLAAVRVRAPSGMHDFAILPERISKEPLGPVVQGGELKILSGEGAQAGYSITTSLSMGKPSGFWRARLTRGLRRVSTLGFAP